MKRLALLVVALIGLVGAFFYFAPQLVSIEVVRRSISREVAGWSGRSLTFEGTPSIAFTPYLTVTFPKVTIGSTKSEEQLVVMDSLSAQVPLLPLIFRGRIEPYAFDFQRPVFHIHVDENGVPNWDLPAGLDQAARVRRLVVADGTIDYSDAGGNHVTIEKIGATLNWPDSSGTARAAGRAVWKGNTADFDASLETLGDFVAGQPAHARLSIDSPPLRMSYDGTVQQLSGFSGKGDLSLSTPSIRKLAALLDPPIAPGATFGAAEIRATAELTRGVLGLGNARLKLDGNAAEGAVSVSFAAPRPAVQATLAFDTLDLSVYADAIAVLVDASKATPGQPLGWPPLDGLDVDLRLSADAVQIDSHKFGRTAASAALRDGRLDLAIGEMQLYGGRLSASLSAEMRDATPSAILQARVEGLALGPALSDLLAPPVIDGTATGTLSLQTGGQSWNALVASLTGKGSATIRDGTLQGVNFAALATPAPTAGSASPVGGTTRFAQAKGDFAIADDKVRASNVTLKGTGFQLQLEGEAPLSGPAVSARGELMLGSGATPGPSTTGIPFVIEGTWQRPVLSRSQPTP